MKIIWSDESLFDLESVRSFIANESQRSAGEVVMLIISITESRLNIFPESGHAGRIQGTYELKIPKLPYYVVYSLDKSNINVVRVYHTARLWPNQF